MRVVAAVLHLGDIEFEEGPAPDSSAPTGDCRGCGGAAGVAVLCWRGKGGPWEDGMCTAQCNPGLVSVSLCSGVQQERRNRRPAPGVDGGGPGARADHQDAVRGRAEDRQPHQAHRRGGQQGCPGQGQRPAWHCRPSLQPSVCLRCRPRCSQHGSPATLSPQPAHPVPLPPRADALLPALHVARVAHQ